jgi:hypothetical protein
MGDVIFVCTSIHDVYEQTHNALIGYMNLIRVKFGEDFVDKISLNSSPFNDTEVRRRLYGARLESFKTMPKINHKSPNP